VLHSACKCIFILFLFSSASARGLAGSSEWLLTLLLTHFLALCSRHEWERNEWRDALTWRALSLFLAVCENNRHTACQSNPARIFQQLPVISISRCWTCERFYLFSSPRHIACTRGVLNTSVYIMRESDNWIIMLCGLWWKGYGCAFKVHLVCLFEWNVRLVCIYVRFVCPAEHDARAPRLETMTCNLISYSSLCF
jgi:hypothetical protein